MRYPYVDQTKEAPMVGGYNKIIANKSANGYIANDKNLEIYK